MLVHALLLLECQLSDQFLPTRWVAGLGACVHIEMQLLACIGELAYCLQLHFFAVVEQVMFSNHRSRPSNAFDVFLVCHL